MGIFDFFAKNKSLENIDLDQYGRFLECNKPLTFTPIWNEATDLFKTGSYTDSFIKFLEYLRNPKEKNIEYDSNGDSVDFSIIHGSTKIKGTFNKKGITATTEIGAYSGTATALFRDLLIKNFVMNYNCFCINDSKVYLKHSSQLKEASPIKLYYALKEMGLKGDIHSLSLFQDFPNLKETSGRSKIDIPASEKSIKIKFLKQWIRDTLDSTSSMSTEKDANLMSHYLLALCYRIDFLLVPKGKVWKIIESSVAIYSDSVLPQPEKIRKIIENLNEILDMDNFETGESFFKTIETFSLVNASPHSDLVKFYLDQFKSAGYYVDLRQENHAMAVYEQMIGYSLYFLGIFPAVKSLLILFYRIFYPEFFEEMDIKSNFYNRETGKFNRSAIEKQISAIISKERKSYPYLSFLLYNLRYETPSQFSFTFLNEITYLNFSQKKK
jgi:hypothetical protein